MQQKKKKNQSSNQQQIVRRIPIHLPATCDGNLGGFHAPSSAYN